VKSSYKIGLTVSAILLAASGAASAADILVGNYSFTGFTTSSTCTLPSTPQTGDASSSTVVYPGAGKNGMILVNPATSENTAVGKGATQVCVASEKVPAAGLNGALMTFKCYNDTETGPAIKASATITAKFKVGATHTPQVATVQVSSAITSPMSCKFTTEGTYSHD
jgi:hypothetical protein